MGYIRALDQNLLKIGAVEQLADTQSRETFFNVISNIDKKKQDNEELARSNLKKSRIYKFSTFALGTTLLTLGIMLATDLLVMTLFMESLLATMAVGLFGSILAANNYSDKKERDNESRKLDSEKEIIINRTLEQEVNQKLDISAHELMSKLNSEVTSYDQTAGTQKECIKRVLDKHIINKAVDPKTMNKEITKTIIKPDISDYFIESSHSENKPDLETETEIELGNDSKRINRENLDKLTQATKKKTNNKVNDFLDKIDNSNDQEEIDKYTKAHRQSKSTRTR